MPLDAGQPKGQERPFTKWRACAKISLSNCISPLMEGAWCSYCNTSSDSSWSVPLAQSSARRRCQPGSGLSWPALHPGALSTGKSEKERDFLLFLEVEKRPRKFSVCHLSQTYAHAVSEWLCSFTHSAQNLLPQHFPDWIFPSSAPAVPCQSYWHNSYISPLAQSKQSFLLVKQEFTKDSAEVALYS